MSDEFTPELIFIQIHFGWVCQLCLFATTCADIVLSENGIKRQNIQSNACKVLWAMQLKRFPVEKSTRKIAIDCEDATNTQKHFQCSKWNPYQP